MENRENPFRDSDGFEYRREGEGCSFEPQSTLMEEAMTEGGGIPGSEGEKKAKSIFSVSHFALVAFILVSQILGVVLQVVAMMILPPEQLENPTLIGYLTMAINVIAMYLTAFPIFVLIMKSVPKPSPIPESKMSFGELATFFLISQAAMLIGAIIGNICNGIVNLVTGVLPENNIDTIINSIPLWLTFLVVVVIGPVIEEIMFRKLLIDRLSVCGEKVAILFSALAFGLFHGNLYQLFYATLVGIILGYVYTKTRRLGYSIGLHIAINFMGSMVPMIITKLTAESSESIILIVNTAYSLLQYSFIVFGLLALVIYTIKRGLSFRNECELPIAAERRVKTFLLNPGTVIFYILCVETMISAIVTEVISYYMA